ncbi:MAG TPA: hypothetical protein PKL78_04645 [Anaerolineales bacterium]|nr:hypothetical protein [Anaerolineales bacterium]
MKTIFRVLMILAVATLIGGLMYIGVSASGSNSGQPAFEGDREGFPGGAEFRLDGDNNGFRPEGGEFRPDGDRRGERGGFGFPGGVIKALVLMSVAGGIYSGIIWAGRKSKRTATT